MLCRGNLYPKSVLIEFAVPEIFKPHIFCVLWIQKVYFVVQKAIINNGLKFESLNLTHLKVIKALYQLFVKYDEYGMWVLCVCGVYTVFLRT